MFFPWSLLSKQWHRQKKDETFLRTWMGTVIRMCIENTLTVFIFCRAAEVSRAHREQLAKRERMWVNTHSWCSERVPDEVHWFVCLLFQGLPGIDGKDGTPGIPGIKVRVASHDDEKVQSQLKMAVYSSSVLFPAGWSWPGWDARSSWSSGSSGEWSVSVVGGNPFYCSAMPPKAHANRPICKCLLSLKPRRGPICSPPHTDRGNQREAGCKSSYVLFSGHSSRLTVTLWPTLF